MKILLITQYFYPETGAPQNRLLAMAEQLSQSADRFDVLTSMPNYPMRKVFNNYRWKLFTKDKKKSIRIFRSFIIPSGNGGVVRRLIEYLSFSISALIYGMFALPKYDIIIYESPPIFVGLTARILKIFKAQHLIANVSDLWTESLISLKVVNSSSIIRVSNKIEMYLYRKSSLVCCQTQGIMDHIAKHIDRDKLYLLRNGADIDYMKSVTSSSSFINYRTIFNASDEDFIVLYAGNIGYAQGAGVIIEAARLLEEDKNKKFFIVGDGPEKNMIVKLKEKYNLKNVYIYDSVSRDVLIAMLDASDAFVVPLKRKKLFRGAIPSKIFEALYLRVPVLLGVEGEAYDIFVNKMDAAIPFEPESHTDLARQISILSNDSSLSKNVSNNGYMAINSDFNRYKIIDSFIGRLRQIND